MPSFSGVDQVIWCIGPSISADNLAVSTNPTVEESAILSSGISAISSDNTHGSSGPTVSEKGDTQDFSANKSSTLSGGLMVPSTLVIVAITHLVHPTG